MRFNLEILGDEKFQQLCQALALCEFRNIQCLPVGQPDGGRDGFTVADSLGEFTVLQVKFSRAPQTKSSREEFIEEIAALELEKVERLKKRGLRNYVLATNIQGTSHLDTGSIDRLNDILGQKFGIDCQCWWRDDIERRLEKYPQIQWSFLEIISGTDVLGMLLSAADKNKIDQRIISSIKSFVAHQYEQDKSTKFKQLDLDRNITDLFIDLPVSVELDESYDSAKSAILSDVASNSTRDEDGVLFSDIIIPGESYRDSARIIKLLLNDNFNSSANRIVLEGAPGQGKSTITQFLCQIHRMKLLQKAEFEQLEPQYRPTEIFLPLRFDLRDYAVWLTGRDPFSDNRLSNRPSSTSDVLESFIAAQINQSTGQDFTATDLAIFAQSAKLLVVLDGFDEVADPSMRNKIVKQVSEAFIRLRECAITLRFIVASRPTAFANSLVFPTADWVNLKLLALTSHEISDYTQKWLTAMKILGQKEIDIIQVLRSKLAHSHVAYLARNPMQLSILLTLVWKQGSYLPDKRTPLYDKYIEIFLDREAEKNDGVRHNREILLQIHGYLAWLLQTEAEGDQSAGKISNERLKKEVENFLRENRFDMQIADSMFSGVTERVVALVSRITGTYEFEVQPLREYFAARFLYDTAPYSPSGDFKSGTLPDRFQAIAKNVYWSNVTRFFAGYYSSGELNSLLYEIGELSKSEDYKYIAHTTRLRFNFLADHVFAQKPKMIPLLVDPILTDPHFDIILSKIISGDEDFSGRLPWGPSQGSVIDYCKNRLTAEIAPDRASAIASLVANVLPEKGLWPFFREVSPEVDLKALHIASCLGVLDKGEIENSIMVARDKWPFAVSYYLLMNRRYDVLDQNPHLWEDLLESVEAGIVFQPAVPRPTSQISKLGVASLLLIGLSSLPSRVPPGLGKQNASLKRLMPTYRALLAATGYTDFDLNDMAPLSRTTSHNLQLLSMISKLAETPIQTFMDDFSAFDDFFCAHQKIHPQSTMLPRLILRVVTLFRYGGERNTDILGIRNLEFSFASLIARTSRRPEDIARVMEDALSESSIKPEFILNAFISLTSKSIIDLRATIEKCVDRVSDKDWDLFCGEHAEIISPSRSFTSSNSIIKPRRDKKDYSFDCGTPRRIAYLVLLVNSADNQLSLVQKLFPNPAECDRNELNVIMWHVEEARRESDFNWWVALPYVEFAYQAESKISFRKSYREPRIIPNDVALTVCSNSEKYPLELVNLCEEALANDVGAKVQQVGLIAVNEKWFNDTDSPIPTKS